jgi:hypothetical protein
MTFANNESGQKKGTLIVVRSLYILSCSLGVYFLIAERLPDAMTTFGVALAFDPYDHTVPWKDRPVYQKLTLIAHLAMVIVLLVVMQIDE